MILAHRTSACRGDYEVLVDGRPVATFARSAWRGGGVLVALFALAVVVHTSELAATG